MQRNRKLVSFLSFRFSSVSGYISPPESLTNQEMTNREVTNEEMTNREVTNREVTLDVEISTTVPAAQIDHPINLMIVKDKRPTTKNQARDL